jgi:hypothetical protein
MTMAQNQEQIEAKLAAYIDGELDEQGRAEIEKHLASNPQHRKLIDELTSMRDLVRALPKEKAPPEIAESIQSQLERSVLLGSPSELAEDPGMRINRWPHRGAIAAIVLLTAGLGIFVYKILPSNRGPSEFAQNTAKEASPATAPMDESDRSNKALTERSVAEKPLADATATTPSTPADALARRTEPMAKGGGEKTEVAMSTPAPAAAPSVAPNAAIPPPVVTSVNPTISNDVNAPSGVALDGGVSNPVNLPASQPTLNAGPAVALNPPKENTDTVAADQLKASPDSQLALNPPAISNATGASNPALLNAMKADRGAVAGKRGIFENNNNQIQQPASNDVVCLRVSTDDPAITNQQVRAYLTSNGIAWAPPPAHVELAAKDVGAGSRFRGREMSLKEGQPQAFAGKGGGDTFARSKTATTQELDKMLEGQGQVAEQKLQFDDLPRKDALAIDVKKEASEPTTQSSQEFQQQESNGAQSIARAPSTPQGSTTAPSFQTLPQQANAKPGPSDGLSASKPGPGNEQPQSQVALQQASPAQQLGAGAEQTQYYCASVKPDQARDLKLILAQRSGQTAQLEEDQTIQFNTDANAALALEPSTTQPTTQPTTAPTGAPQSGALAQSQTPAAQTQSQAPFGGGGAGFGGKFGEENRSGGNAKVADGSNVNAIGGGNFDVQAGAPMRQQASQEAQKLVDLYIVVQREAPTTQPADAAKAAEPVNHPPPPAINFKKLP